MDWAQVVNGLVLAGAIGVGALLYRIFTKGFKTLLRDEVGKHLVPNGGSSLADRVTKMEIAIGELTKSVERSECLPGCPHHNGSTPT